MRETPPPHRPAPNVLLFLSQGFEDLEAAAVISVCGWTRYREHLPAVHVTTAGLHEEVRGRFGTVVRPDLHVSAANPADYAALAIPGGFFSHGFDEAFDPALYRLIREVHAQGGTIATLCVGVLPVAEAGLLRGRRATTYPFSRNHDNPGRLRELGCTPTAGPIEVCDRIISCSGPSSSLDVAFLLLEGVVGRDAAQGVRRYMNGTKRGHSGEAL
ncbi:MAG: DJ-1/PfpI family protein [Deferrisomatales bacterium]|nr:DJ-1/PfpI family protein [Deferrisomatales bacterium]